MIKKSFLRRGIEYILLLLLAIFVASCGVRNKNSQVYSTPKEKEVTLLRKITTIYIDKPKKALQMLDSAEQHRLIPIEEIQNLRAMSYFYGLDNPQKALECANKGYSNAIENVDTLAQLNSLKVLVTVYYMQSHYTEVIIKSNEAIELALKIKDKESVAFFYMALGSAKSEIDNLNDALDYLNKSIEIYQTIVEDSARWATYDNMLYALTKQVDVYASNRFYDKAVSLIPRCLALLDYLKKSDSATIGLNDIREAELMAACSKAYYGAGETKKAEKCYEKLRLTKYGNTDHGIALAIPYLVNSGQYAEALRCIKIKKKHMQKCHSIVTYYYNKVLLRNEFKCYYHLNMYKEASFSANENMVMADSLRAREKKDYVRTVKKVFADRDIQLQLIKHEQKAETSQIVILLATILVVALGLLLAISIRYNNILRRKDRANLATMEELRKLYNERTRQHTDTIAVDENEDDDEDRKMFVVIYNEIITRKLYLKPGFSRDDAISIVPMSMKQFSALFQKYSTGFVSFVNNLRLEHSLELIRSNQEYTIEGIALDSGFSNRQTFHRLFVEKYGMTPTEYKRLLNAENT